MCVFVKVYEYVQCMYVCMYVCMYICMYVYVCVCVYMYTYAQIYVCMPVCVCLKSFLGLKYQLVIHGFIELFMWASFIFVSLLFLRSTNYQHGWVCISSSQINKKVMAVIWNWIYSTIKKEKHGCFVSEALSSPAAMPTFTLPVPCKLAELILASHSEGALSLELAWLSFGEVQPWLLTFLRACKAPGWLQPVGKGHHCTPVFETLNKTNGCFLVCATYPCSVGYNIFWDQSFQGSKLFSDPLDFCIGIIFVLVRIFIAVKRHHDQGNFYKGQHLIGAGL
jgi:nuclear pore complex protein Nup62